MGVLNDLGIGVVAGENKETGYPIDKYGHLLDPYDPWDGVAIDGWLSVGTKLYHLTNPYGVLQFAIGNGDDFWCFDYRIIRGMFEQNENQFLVLHATINSETGCFIEEGYYGVIPIDKYSNEASVIVSEALLWCDINEVRHSKKGWNQDQFYFARCVELDVRRAKGDVVPKFSERQRRFGGKRILKFLLNGGRA